MYYRLGVDQVVARSLTYCILVPDQSVVQLLGHCKNHAQASAFQGSSLQFRKSMQSSQIFKHTRSQEEGKMEDKVGAMQATVSRRPYSRTNH